MFYILNLLWEVDDSFDDGIVNGDGIDFILFLVFMNLKVDFVQLMFVDVFSVGFGFFQISQ